jgi:hypothetical protein
MAELGDALVWSSEDDFQDTILPRFLAAGGDPSRVFSIGPVDTTGGERRPFDPAMDIPKLIEAARTVPTLRFILIDPIVMAVAGDSHKNAETRRGLQPLVDLAEHSRAALVGITHFTKGTDGKDPIERITGSLAFGAVARVALAAAASEDGTKRRLVRAASNIGPSGGGFEYSLFQEPLRGYDNIVAQRIRWGGRLHGAARTLLEEIRTQSAQLSAAAFIADLVKDGTMPVNEIKAAATANGFAWRTIERAKKGMPHIVARQVSNSTWGKPAAWHWTNSGAQTANSAPKSDRSSAIQ